MEYLEWDETRDAIPKPKLTAKARIGFFSYTVERVTPAGTRVTLKRIGDDATLVVKRASFGRLPAELCLSDVSPMYYTADQKPVRFYMEG